MTGTATMPRLALCGLLGAFFLLGGCTHTRPARYGVPNFGAVDERVWRGGQPAEASFAALYAAGARGVLNLCASDGKEWEESAARDAGLAYKRVPLPQLSAPERKDVDLCLLYLEVMPGPVLVHCRQGKDRTGTIVACRRIKAGWSVKDALAEADSYGFSDFEVGMREFVESYRP